MVKRYEDDEAFADAKKNAGRKSWEGHDAPTVSMSAAEAEALPELTLDDALQGEFPEAEAEGLTDEEKKLGLISPTQLGAKRITEALGSEDEAVDLGTSTVTPPPMTAEQRKRWEAALRSARGTAGEDYGTGLKWTEEDTQRVKQIGDVAAQVVVAPYGLYKDLTEIQKLLAAGSVGAAAGVGVMAAAGPIGKGLKHASKVIRRVLQSSDAKQAQHLDDWLAGKRSAEGLDPEVVEAVEILRDPKRVTAFGRGTPAQVDAEAGLARARDTRPGRAQQPVREPEFKPDFGEVEQRIRMQQNYRKRVFGSDADLSSLDLDEIDARLEHIRSTGASMPVQRDEIDSLLDARRQVIQQHHSVRRAARADAVREGDAFVARVRSRSPRAPTASRSAEAPPPITRQTPRRRDPSTPSTDDVRLTDPDVASYMVGEAGLTSAHPLDVAAQRTRQYRSPPAGEEVAGVYTPAPGKTSTGRYYVDEEAMRRDRSRIGAENAPRGLDVSGRHMSLSDVNRRIEQIRAEAKPLWESGQHLPPDAKRELNALLILRQERLPQPGWAHSVGDDYSQYIRGRGHSGVGADPEYGRSLAAPEDVFSDVKREGALTPERIEAANTPRATIPEAELQQARDRVRRLRENTARMKRLLSEGFYGPGLGAQELAAAEGELKAIRDAYGDLLD